MEESLDRAIAEIAARQHSVFTLEQADDVGFVEDQRMFRVRTGRWRMWYPGVYSIAGLPDVWRASVLAACWGAVGPAVASHRAAAELWGLPGGGTGLVEITCRRWRRSKAAGLVVHETKLLDDDDMELVDGIPTASVEQTLLGVAAVLRPSTAEMAIDRAVHLKLTTVEQLQQFVNRKGKKGRNGIGVLRALVDARDPLAGVPESVMETRMKQLLRRHGFPTPVFQYEIRHQGRFVARVDAAYPEYKIALEYDSYEHHTGTVAHDRDNDRRNRLRRIEWRTVVFTAADLRRDGGEALETLRAELAFGAAHL
jgi:hypothetical protein